MTSLNRTPLDLIVDKFNPNNNDSGLSFLENLELMQSQFEREKLQMEKMIAEKRHDLEQLEKLYQLILDSLKIKKRCVEAFKSCERALENPPSSQKNETQIIEIDDCNQIPKEVAIRNEKDPRTQQKSSYGAWRSPRKTLTTTQTAGLIKPPIFDRIKSILSVCTAKQQIDTKKRQPTLNYPNRIKLDEDLLDKSTLLAIHRSVVCERIDFVAAAAATTSWITVPKCRKQNFKLEKLMAKRNAIKLARLENEALSVEFLKRADLVDDLKRMMNYDFCRPESSRKTPKPRKKKKPKLTENMMGSVNDFLLTDMLNLDRTETNSSSCRQIVKSEPDVDDLYGDLNDGELKFEIENSKEEGEVLDEVKIKSETNNMLPIDANTFSVSSRNNKTNNSNRDFMLDEKEKMKSRSSSWNISTKENCQNDLRQCNNNKKHNSVKHYHKRDNSNHNHSHYYQQQRRERSRSRSRSRSKCNKRRFSKRRSRSRSRSRSRRKSGSRQPQQQQSVNTGNINKRKKTN